MGIICKTNLKVLWFTKTYSFVWAHKPLCTKYREEVIKLKKIYLCRSCFFTYLGILIGMVVIILTGRVHWFDSKILLLILLTYTFPLSFPTIYKSLNRRIRDFLRLTLGVVIPLTIYVLIKGYLVMFVSVVLLSIIFWKKYYIQRAKRKIMVCKNCDEYSETNVCSGFEHQATKIREYEEEATTYLLSTGYLPEVLRKKENTP